MPCCGGPRAGSLVAPQQAPTVARRPSLFEALDEIDLQSIIADPADRVHLRRWARRWACLGPIDFLIELSEMQAAIDRDSADKVREIAERIARTYLAKDAVHTVWHDIDDGLRDKITDAFLFTSADMAKSVIYQTKAAMLRFVQSDILGRFRESEDFKAMRNLHPRYVLATMKPVREAFLKTVSETEKDAVLLWHSAWEHQEQQLELNRRGNELLRKSAFMDSAKHQLEELGLERTSPLHMGMSSAMRTSMRKLQDWALAGFVEAYVAFIVGPRGSELILELDPDPEVRICFNTLSHSERFELCSDASEDPTVTVGGDAVASDGDACDYTCGW